MKSIKQLASLLSEGFTEAQDTQLGIRATDLDLWLGKPLDNKVIKDLKSYWKANYSGRLVVIEKSPIFEVAYVNRLSSKYQRRLNLKPDKPTLFPAVPNTKAHFRENFPTVFKDVETLWVAMKDAGISVILESDGANVANGDIVLSFIEYPANEEPITLLINAATSLAWNYQALGDLRLEHPSGMYALDCSPLLNAKLITYEDKLPASEYIV